MTKHKTEVTTEEKEDLLESFVDLDSACDDTDYPNYVTKARLNYIDSLKQGGMANMDASIIYISAEFNVSRTIARDVLNYWYDNKD